MTGTVPPGWRWVNVARDSDPAAAAIWVRPAEVSAIEPCDIRVAGGNRAGSRIHLLSRTAILSPLNPSVVHERLAASLAEVMESSPFAQEFGDELIVERAPVDHSGPREQSRWWFR